MFTDPQSPYIEQLLVFYLIAYKDSNQNIILIQKETIVLALPVMKDFESHLRKVLQVSLTSYSR